MENNMRSIIHLLVVLLLTIFSMNAHAFYVNVEDQTVRALAVQADGKVIVGGTFSRVNGVGRNRIARLNTDGSLDTGFTTTVNAGLFDGVFALEVLADGKILIGGRFTGVNGVSRSRIARLNVDGSLDLGFMASIGTQFTGGVFTMAVQTDGKVLVGGEFRNVNGVRRSHLVRLNSDGSLDTGFTTEVSTGQSDGVFAMALQADGKVLISGTFDSVNGVTRNFVARLNTDGSTDTGFVVDLFPVGGGINALAIQPDGKVLIGGGRLFIESLKLDLVARLNTDGSLDTGFTVGATTFIGGFVRSLVLQADGKVLMGGSFTRNNGASSNDQIVSRLNVNGGIDTGFKNSTSSRSFIAYDLVLQTDGKVLIGGNFTRINGTARKRIALLNADGSVEGDGATCFPIEAADSNVVVFCL